MLHFLELFHFRSKNFAKLVDGLKYQMKYDDSVASMVVRDVVERDAGHYTCEASNKHGSVATTAQLKVKGRSLSKEAWSGKYFNIPSSSFAI